MDTTPLSIALAGIKLEIDSSSERFPETLDAIAGELSPKDLVKSGNHIKRMLEALDQEGANLLEKISSHAEIALYPSITSSEQEAFITKYSVK